MTNIVTVIVPNISFFNKHDNFEKQCLDFLNMYGNMIKIINNNETEENNNNENDNNENDNNENDNNENDNNNDNINENNNNNDINNDNDDNINDNINDDNDDDNDNNDNGNINNDDNDLNVKNVEEENMNRYSRDLLPIRETRSNTKMKIPGGFNSFISLKMEIDTNLMFKLIIFLMIICIVIIVLFILHVEMKPLRNYKIPLDYNNYTIQPPYHNVKKWDIHNKENGIMSSLKQIKSNLYDKPKIKTNAEQIKDEVKEMVDANTPKETFFSTSYDFGI